MPTDSPPVRSPDPRVQRIVALFESLTPGDLIRLDRFYTEDARFKDPFNTVQGIDAIRGVFQHMFDALEQPRFEVLEVIVQDDRCFLTWNFHFGQPRLGPGPQCIRGGSHLRLAHDGRIAWHRDYWDAAEELYEKLPIIGALLRWLRRRAAR